VTTPPSGDRMCPQYRDHIGKHKCNCLARLAVEWFSPSRPRFSTMDCRVEALRWGRILDPTPLGEGRYVVVLAGLDNWGSRVLAMEDVRRHFSSQEASGHKTAFIQIGLDRGQASIAVFGIGYDDPCPACGKQSLPEPEPCVYLGENGRLLRGNLRQEAQAAARQFCKIVEDLAEPSGQSTWLNRKANLTVDLSSGRGELITRPTEHQPDCLGPHSNVGPIRWTSIPPSARTGGGS
jgi:hypothetical protein